MCNKEEQIWLHIGSTSFTLAFPLLLLQKGCAYKLKLYTEAHLLESCLLVMSKKHPNRAVCEWLQGRKIYHGPCRGWWNQEVFDLTPFPFGIAGPWILTQEGWVFGGMSLPSSLSAGFRIKSLFLGHLPGGPVAKTPSSRCRGPGFDPWSGN